MLKRLEMSKKILSDQPEMNISDIAYLCGFSTSQYFATMFKKHEKCTPLEYRKRTFNYV
jgi:AraC family L-rhamnose operon regulatory protein RhaS